MKAGTNSVLFINHVPLPVCTSDLQKRDNNSTYLSGCEHYELICVKWLIYIKNLVNVDLLSTVSGIGPQKNVCWKDIDGWTDDGKYPRVKYPYFSPSLHHIALAINNR